MSTSSSVRAAQCKMSTFIFLYFFTWSSSFGLYALWLSQKVGLDSVTIGNTQAMRAAQGTGVKVIKRKVFLDDTQNEADIRYQFNRAIALARRNGSAIAIGHPHPTTVRVLQQMVYNLPPDITLVRPSSLLNEPQVDTSTPNTAPPSVQPPRNPFRGVKQCKSKRPPEPVSASRFFTILSESITQSTLVQYYQLKWQGWDKPTN